MRCVPARRWSWPPPRLMQPSNSSEGRRATRCDTRCRSAPAAPRSGAGTRGRDRREDGQRCQCYCHSVSAQHVVISRHFDAFACKPPNCTTFAHMRASLVVHHIPIVQGNGTFESLLASPNEWFLRWPPGSPPLFTTSPGPRRAPYAWSPPPLRHHKTATPLLAVPPRHPPLHAPNDEWFLGQETKTPCLTCLFGLPNRALFWPLAALNSVSFGWRRFYGRCGRMCFRLLRGCSHCSAVSAIWWRLRARVAMSS